MSKLKRANVHIGSLRRAVRNFVRNGPYGIEIEVDQNSYEYIVIGRVRKDVYPTDFSGYVTDAVNNLRSALDNLAWELSVEYQSQSGKPGPPPDPIPSGNRWRDIQFPVCTLPSAWSRPLRDKLWAIDPRLKADIGLMQPFYTDKDDPEREPLAVLDQLWNIDKHRHIHLIQGFVGLEGITSRAISILSAGGVTLPADWSHEFTITHQHDRGPFQDGAELGRFSEAGTMRLAGAPLYAVAHLAIGVAFKPGPPFFSWPVVDLLTDLSQRTRNIVTQFRSAFR